MARTILGCHWLGCGVATVLGVLSWPLCALAHDPGLSSVSLTLLERGRAAEVQLIVNDADLPPRRRAHGGACDGAGALGFSLGEERLVTTVRCAAHGPRQTRFEASVAPLAAGPLRVGVSLLAELPRGHRCFARVLDSRSGVPREQMLDADAAVLAIDVAPGVGAGVPSFLWMGVEHIVTGFDHLLFLGVLLLGVKGLARTLRLITSFTLAHCATLALSTLGLLHVSGAWVEVSIAASVVWVAVRNCGSRPGSGERLWVTFAFGLIHGLGFASVLREVGLGADGASVIAPLLQFNLGVEAGQLALAMLALPVLGYVQRAWPLCGTRLLSAMAALVGLVWIVERSQALWG